MAKCSDFAVECLWNWQFSQNFGKTWAFFYKIRLVFGKTLNFSKVAKHSNFAVAVDRISMIYQKVRKIWAGLDKMLVFLKKTHDFFKNGLR